MDYYECHVTMVPDRNEKRIRQIVEDELGWKYSAIDGDTNLGAGVKAYATRQLNVKLGDAECLRLLHRAADILVGEGVKVVRRKVERVIYDDRSSKVAACTDDCAVCHMEELAR